MPQRYRLLSNLAALAVGTGLALGHVPAARAGGVPGALVAAARTSRASASPTARSRQLVAEAQAAYDARDLPRSVLRRGPAFSTCWTRAARRSTNATTRCSSASPSTPRRLRSLARMGKSSPSQSGCCATAPTFMTLTSRRTTKRMGPRRCPASRSVSRAQPLSAGLRRHRRSFQCQRPSLGCTAIPTRKRRRRTRRGLTVDRWTTSTPGRGGRPLIIGGALTLAGGIAALIAHRHRQPTNQGRLGRVAGRVPPRAERPRGRRRAAVATR